MLTSFFKLLRLSSIPFPSFSPLHYRTAFFWHCVHTSRVTATTRHSPKSNAPSSLRYWEQWQSITTYYLDNLPRTFPDDLPNQPYHHLISSYLTLPYRIPSHPIFPSSPVDQRLLGVAIGQFRGVRIRAPDPPAHLHVHRSGYYTNTNTPTYPLTPLSLSPNSLPLTLQPAYMSTVQVTTLSFSLVTQFFLLTYISSHLSHPNIALISALLYLSTHLSFSGRFTSPP